MRALSQVIALLGAGLLPLASAAEVTLTSEDGLVTLKGELLSFDDSTFVLETSVGTLQLDRNVMQCIGDDCPIETPKMVFSGSDTLGDVLMPTLISAFAQSQGASISNPSDRSDDIVELLATGPKGDLFKAEVQAAGSSIGLQALIEGETQVAMSSRPPKAEEIAQIAQQGRGDITDISQNHVIAVDSIVVATSPDNPVNELTMAQLAQLYAGTITNWNEVGGPDLPVKLLTRPETSDARGVFVENVLAPVELAMAASAEVVSSASDMAERIKTTPGAIGYVGFADSAETNPLNLIAECGIVMTPSAFAAKTEEYPLGRRLHLLTANQGVSDKTRALIDFATSPEADQYIRDAGFLDLGVEEYPEADQRSRLLADPELELGAAELTAIGEMVRELEGATRLSTTLRFEAGSNLLDTKSQRDIERVLQYLGQPENEDRTLILAGFTDGDGPFAINRDLSIQRANAARDTLLQHPSASNLAELNVAAFGFSELAPVACNSSEIGRDRNRRVELWLK